MTSKNPSSDPGQDSSQEFKVTISKPRHCTGCDSEIASGQQVVCHCKHCTWWKCPECGKRNQGRK